MTKTIIVLLLALVSCISGCASRPIVRPSVHSATREPKWVDPSITAEELSAILHVAAANSKVTLHGKTVDLKEFPIVSVDRFSHVQVCVRYKTYPNGGYWILLNRKGDDWLVDSISEWEY